MSYLIQTYSEYEYIVRSYEFVGHMFSNGSGYAGLIACVAIATIMFGTVTFLAGQTLSGKGSIMILFMNVMLAAGIMILIVSDKSDVRIHDIPTGRWKVVGGVPTVLAILAYMENNIEIATTDMIETVMSPLIPYDEIGSGRGFDLLASFDEMGRSFYSRNPYAYESLANYWRECVVTDLTYGWIDQKKLYSSDDLWKAIQSETKSHTSVYVFEQAGKRVTAPKPCAEAYLLIDAQLNAKAMSDELKNMCEKTSDGSNAAVNANCVNGVDGIIEKGMGISTVDRNAVIRSYLVSWVIMSEGGQLTSMLADVNKKNAASAFMAEKMLPRLKGMMYGMMIGIFPLLVVFIWVSPGRTMIFYSGLFLMMILWNAIDTFMDMQYQHEVYNMFAIMRKDKLGLHQMFDLPNLAADAVSLYGSGRWMSLGLATAIAGAITKVNSYALSQMGSQLGSSAQSTAAANSAYMDSAGQTKLAEQAGRDLSARMIADAAPITNHAMGIANYETFSKTTQTQTGNGAANTTGINNAAAVSAGNTTGNIAATNAFANSLQLSAHDYAFFKNTGGQINQGIADAMARNGLVSQATANSMVGLKLDMNALGIGTDGKLTNIQASGTRDGKDWQITDAGSEARYQAESTGAHKEIKELTIGKGASVTEKYNSSGVLSGIAVEQGGNVRFSAMVNNGKIQEGTMNGRNTNFDKEGNPISTVEHSGVNKKTFTMTPDGSKTTTSETYNPQTKKYDVTGVETLVGKNGHSVGSLHFQEGAVISQNMNGTSTITGTTQHGKTTATIDANGKLIHDTSDKGSNKSESHLTKHTGSTLVQDNNGNWVIGNGTLEQTRDGITGTFTTENGSYQYNNHGGKYISHSQIGEALKDTNLDENTRNAMQMAQDRGSGIVIGGDVVKSTLASGSSTNVDNSSKTDDSKTNTTGEKLNIGDKTIASIAIGDTAVANQHANLFGDVSSRNIVNADTNSYLSANYMKETKAVESSLKSATQGGVSLEVPILGKIFQTGMDTSSTAKDGSAINQYMYNVEKLQTEAFTTAKTQGMSEEESNKFVATATAQFNEAWLARGREINESSKLGNLDNELKNEVKGALNVMGENKSKPITTDYDDF